MTEQRDADPTLAIHELSEEDLVLRALEMRDPQAAPAAHDAERPWRELSGLLSEQLVPEEPRLAVKAALFGRLGLECEDAVGSEATNVVPMSRGRAEHSEPPVRHFSFLQSPDMLRLAAAAAIVMALAMAAFSGFLASELRQEQSVTAQLQAALDQRSMQPTQIADGSLALQAGFEMKAQPGTRLCKLASRDPDQPNAAASMFLQPDEGRWVLDARNLKRCPLGRVYQVWFLTEQGPVRGGAFQIKDRAPIVLGSDDLPQGTQAVMVTLENAQEVGAEPAGPTVLFGDESREIL